MTLAPVLLPLLLLVGSPAQKGALRVAGTVEMTAVEALRSAEDAAIRTIWERHGQNWRDGRSLFVPAPRLEAAMGEWLRSRFENLDVVTAEPMGTFETTAGKAYRQDLVFHVQGAEAESFKRSGDRLVRRINRTYTKRSTVIGGLWLLLLLACCRLDRITHGYLTWRIRFGALAMAAVAAVSIYP